jgi:hypothetical protein
MAVNDGQRRCHSEIKLDPTVRFELTANCLQSTEARALPG